MLKPIIEAHGRVFIKHDANPLVRSAKVDPAAIGTAAAALAHIRRHHASLNFRKKDLSDGLNLVIDEFPDLVRPEHRDDYATTNTRRMMNMFNHVSLACSRQRPPQWALALPWMIDKPSAQREPKVKDAPTYIYGFDKWAMCAWRCDASKSPEQEELASSWDQDDTAPSTAPCGGDLGRRAQAYDSWAYPGNGCRICKRAAPRCHFGVRGILRRPTRNNIPPHHGQETRRPIHVGGSVRADADGAERDRAALLQGR